MGTKGASVGKANAKEIGKYSGRPLHVPRRMLTREVRPGYAFLCGNGRMVLPGQTVPAGEPIEGQEHKLMKVPAAERAVDVAPVNRAMEGAPKAKRARAAAARAKQSA